ncbi:FAD-binding and (Fe-S)-binding domain-containing protein [Pseudoflavitalea rhizosphaerae]|uniref:FAD-binding and (Fe-S)-binding domain-containing protein n=1 Tax=Pseudoflavitalea rhizosphaerae TaxID=1884793 RepID=UPI000F8F0387|nr:FAD-binding and (Fe-S)-binding domain-containing protein [Pseudoflavitalea rhizosphaerae]
MNIESALQQILPADRIKCKLIDLISFAADAGFYYLKPQAVVNPVSDQEIRALFNFSHQHNIPLTFRTAGTSLSGQSITDGILVDLSKFWNSIQIEEEGARVRVQPGITGAMVNARLRRYGKKIGPDPASIQSAMIGGIVSNNASGMCCGVQKNAYHTIQYVKFMLPNGLSYSTELSQDYERFENENTSLAASLRSLRDTILNDPALFELIREKYKTKNTVGYSVNALIDYEKPLDMLAHLMVGAEGTLGFISEVVLRTVPDYPEKSTALLCFTDIQTACKAIAPLIESGAEAVELMDNASLRSVAHLPGIPEILAALPPTGVALLTEYQAYTTEDITASLEKFNRILDGFPFAIPPAFTNDPAKQAFLWKVRKGMFPSVGAMRLSGTTVILEDIAVPVVQLGDAILDLQQLFTKYGYHDAIIFGHAKDGNIHFVVTQTFNLASEVERYDRFIREVVELVTGKYKGALKAEHGTGRNMAPFVETEWGPAIYDIMKTIKQETDPRNLLNPGVLISTNGQAHIQHLKALPKVEEEVDKCIECGFCEVKCPSRDLTMTPRRRIVARRQMALYKETGQTKEYKELLDQYQYDGLETCAVDGLCAEACPVDINTGMLVKRLRKENHSKLANAVAMRVAKNFGATTTVVGAAVKSATVVNRLLGKNAMVNLTKGMKKIVSSSPLWSNQVAPSSLGKVQKATSGKKDADTVVYFTTCINRKMGGSVAGKKSMAEIFMSIAERSGLRMIIPDNINSACCGQIFSSKGFTPAFEFTANQTIEKLWDWTEKGKWPVVLDISSCTYTLQTCRPQLTEENKRKFDAIRIIDSIDLIADHILPRVQLSRKKNNIVLHPVCTLQKTKQESKFLAVAKQLANDVTVPLHAGCCGMAGDRGFLFPELTRSATAAEVQEVNQCSYDGYYSSSKTCEMALSEASGKNYESIVYLLDECL